MSGSKIKIQNHGQKPNFLVYLWIFVSAFLFGVDRYVKTMLLNGVWGDWRVNDWLGIKTVFNDGMAFGWGSGWGLLISLVGLIIFLYFIVRYYHLWLGQWWTNAAVGMVLGGALSNIYDRLINNGQVIDYISVNFYSNFNLADVAIVVGLLILVVKLWKE